MEHKNNFEKVCELIKKYSTADDYIVNYQGLDSNLTRFANNMLTQNLENESESVTLTSYFDGKKASMETGKLSKEDIKILVSRTEDTAKRSIQDVEYIESLTCDNQNIHHNLDEELINLCPSKRAGFADIAIDKAYKNNCTVAGAFKSHVEHFGVYTKNGLSKFHIDSASHFSSTFDKNNQKSNCRTSSSKLADLEVHLAAEEGIKDVNNMQTRKTFSPGKYDVLLNSHAFGEMNLMAYYYGMDRKAYDKGYSAFNGKMDTQIAPSNINFYVDPSHVKALSAPFNNEGLAHSKNSIIENGILKSLPSSRFWAHKNKYTPWSACNFIMTGEDNSENDLIKKIERGFYIKDIWYIRLVKAEDLTLTGMTRNALYYIEDGEIKSGATHFRWNDSPLNMFNRIMGLTQPTQSNVYGLPTYMPSVLVKDFNLTSGTLF